MVLMQRNMPVGRRCEGARRVRVATSACGQGGWGLPAGPGAGRGGGVVSAHPSALRMLQPCRLDFGSEMKVSSCQGVCLSRGRCSGGVWQHSTAGEAERWSERRI